MLVGRIVAAYGIHVHLFDETHVVDTYLLVGRATAVGPERVAVDTFEHHLHTVDIETVFGAEVDRAETDTLFIAMQHGTVAATQVDRECIEIGILGVPRTDIVPTARQGNKAVAGRSRSLQLAIEHLARCYRRKGGIELICAIDTREKYLGIDRTVGTRIDRQTVDMTPRV